MDSMLTIKNHWSEARCTCIKQCTTIEEVAITIFAIALPRWQPNKSRALDLERAHLSAHRLKQGEVCMGSTYQRMISVAGSWRL